MSNDKENQPITELISGVTNEKGVEIKEKRSIDNLNQRGYGTTQKEILILTFYEALFLTEKKILTVKNKKGIPITFQSLLQKFQEKDENAWTHYLVYRDLRSRGYVVREGFGKSIDFRIYERGTYGKENATSLVLATQEGKPLSIEDLTNTISQTQRLKKDLVLAVINRRGEIVYYSVSTLTLK